MAKFLCFSPHSAIWVHAYAEALIAESLKQRGHEISYVTCGGVFRRYCVAMSADGLTHASPVDKKAATCVSCGKNAALLRKEFGFGAGKDLAAYLTPEDHARAEALMASVTRENFAEFTIEGQNLGRSCLLEFILQYKKNNLRFSEAEWAAYRDTLHNTLLSFFGAKRILAAERPDFVLIYATSYSVNLAFARYAESLGIPVYRLYGGSCIPYRHRTLVIDRGVKCVFNQNSLAHWPDFRTQPVSRRLVGMVVEHFMELMKGQHFVAYSAPKDRESAVDIRARFGIRPEQKLLVAVMSSYDERFALETVGLLPVEDTLFPNQAEWIRHLIAYVKARPELFLIIRVHPRDFPNKRESQLSDNAQVLREILVDLPPNVAVNWPSDRLSVYDLIDYADVGVNSWSSVGKEMALLGIPVVSYSDKILGYPGELNLVGLTLPEYEARLAEAVRMGWSPEKIPLVFRWYATEFLRPTVDLGASAPNIERPTKFLPRLVRKIIRTLDPVFYQRRDCRRRLAQIPSAPMLERVFAQRADSVLSIPPDNQDYLAVRPEEETAAIRAELGRLVGYMYGDRLKRGAHGPLGERLKRHLQIC